MKYVELKTSLKRELKNSYLIFGEDRYLCFDALNKIEAAANITIKDMNSITISGESTTAKSIVESANLYPFGDEYRLVVVKNFNPVKDKQAAAVIQQYLNQPLSSTILVFFAVDGAEFYKGMKNLEQVDCDKLDGKTISIFVKNILAKNGISSNDAVINEFILYCNYDMARVSKELEKLIAFADDTKVITMDVVQSLVSRDREFQVFQLSELIAKGNGEDVNEFVNKMAIKPGTSYTILTPMYNHYRRALFVSINKDKTPAELAELLSVKEYAIKMVKNQLAVFSTKQLKLIVDKIADYDKRIKTGLMKENIAIKSLVFYILNLRGK